MNDQSGKDLFKSRSTWGVIVAFAAVVAQQAGLDIGDQDGWVETITGAIAAGVALYGRFAAVQPITSVAGIEVKK